MICIQFTAYDRAGISFMSERKIVRPNKSSEAIALWRLNARSRGAVRVKIDIAEKSC